MNLNLETSIPALTVFFQGLLSFFSPCVLPLIPLYLSYLSGGAKTTDENGMSVYRKSIVLKNTIFFVFGVSFAFFALGLGFSTLGQLLGQHANRIARIGGILVIFFGLYQLGVFGASRTLSQERRIPFSINKVAMNPLTAFILGFTFSFAWTPCVGPALASVLIMAASASSSATGFALVGVYTVGFTIPFIMVGLFTGKILDVFKKYKNAMNYTVKIGGVLMIIMGIMMFTGWMNNITGYLSSVSLPDTPATEGSSTSGDASVPQTKPEDSTKPVPNEDVEVTTPPTDSSAESEANEIVPAPSFSLKDQFGKEHNLSDYKDKTIFLNFWATWCPPCRSEMPSIQKLYEEYGSNEEDVIVLGVAAPNYGSEGSIEDISSFLENNGYTYPVLMDETGDLFAQYGISAFPTTFMIDRDGNIFGYVPGAVSFDIMKSIVQQTIAGVQ